MHGARDQCAECADIALLDQPRGILVGLIIRLQLYIEKTGV